MTSCDFRVDRDIAVLTLRHPPVNALCLALRRSLVECFARIAVDTGIAAAVLHGAGRGFCAGGDRSEFGTPAAVTRPTLSLDVLDALESCGKPVVAALHGFALGGGLELALACSARVAVADTRIGLPEVGIGLMPLSATQRLPRILGIEAAAQMMLGAKVLEARSLAGTRLFDALVDDAAQLPARATALARTLTAAPARPVRDWPWPEAEPAQALQAVLRSHPVAACTPAQRAVLQALRAAVEAHDFQAGLDRAQQIFDELGGTRRAFDPRDRVY